MKIVSWNVNGLRSVYKSGFVSWLEKSQADIICLQEIKIQHEQIPENLLNNSNYLSYFNCGGRKGYAGVAVFTKDKPKSVELSLGFKRFDSEGRILILEYPNFTLINLYLPHGGRGKENLDYKLAVYDHLLGYLRKMLQNCHPEPIRPEGSRPRRLSSGSKKIPDRVRNDRHKNVILTGDFNVAHTELDLARPKDNLKNTMFTPEERAKLDALQKLGFVDTFRCFNGGGGNYTWWPYFANARTRNLGWRIDYCFVSKPMAKGLKDAFILKNIPGSDHCPIGVEIG